MRDKGYGHVRWERLERELRDRIEEFDILAETEALENEKFGNKENNGRSDVIYYKQKIDDEVRPLYAGTFAEYDARYKKAQIEEKEHNWDELREKILNS